MFDSKKELSDVEEQRIRRLIVSGDSNGHRLLADIINFKPEILKNISFIKTLILSMYEYKNRALVIDDRSLFYDSPLCKILLSGVIINSKFRNIAISIAGPLDLKELVDIINIADKPSRDLKRELTREFLRNFNDSSGDHDDQIDMAYILKSSKIIEILKNNILRFSFAIPVHEFIRLLDLYDRGKVIKIVKDQVISRLQRGAIELNQVRDLVLYLPEIVPEAPLGIKIFDYNLGEAWNHRKTLRKFITENAFESFLATKLTSITNIDFYHLNGLKNQIIKEYLRLSDAVITCWQSIISREILHNNQCTSTYVTDRDINTYVVSVVDNIDNKKFLANLLSSNCNKLNNTEAWTIYSRLLKLYGNENLLSLYKDMNIDECSRKGARRYLFHIRTHLISKIILRFGVIPDAIRDLFTYMCEFNDMKSMGNNFNFTGKLLKRLVKLRAEELGL